MDFDLQGWHPDPHGRHEWRYFSAGRATYLVRDGSVEGADPLDQQDIDRLNAPATTRTAVTSSVRPAPIVQPESASDRKPPREPAEPELAAEPVLGPAPALSAREAESSRPEKPSRLRFRRIRSSPMQPDVTPQTVTVSALDSPPAPSTGPPLPPAKPFSRWSTERDVSEPAAESSAVSDLIPVLDSTQVLRESWARASVPDTQFPASEPPSWQELDARWSALAPDLPSADVRRLPVRRLPVPRLPVPAEPLARPRSNGSTQSEIDFASSPVAADRPGWQPEPLRESESVRESEPPRESEPRSIPTDGAVSAAVGAAVGARDVLRAAAASRAARAAVGQLGPSAAAARLAPSAIEAQPPRAALPEAVLSATAWPSITAVPAAGGRTDGDFVRAQPYDDQPSPPPNISQHRRSETDEIPAPELSREPGPASATAPARETAPALPRAPRRRRRRRFRLRWPIIVSVASVIALASGVVVALSGSSKHAAAPPRVTGAADAGSTVPVGVLVTSKDGHFKDRFRVQPVEKNVPIVMAGKNSTFHLALCRSPVTEVGTESASVPIPASEYQNTVRVAANSLGLYVSLKIVRQVSTKFRDFPARTVTYVTGAGAQLTMVLFSYSPTRVYVLIAQSGPAFDALETSFAPLP